MSLGWIGGNVPSSRPGKSSDERVPVTATQIAKAASTRDSVLITIIGPTSSINVRTTKPTTRTLTDSSTLDNKLPKRKAPAADEPQYRVTRRTAGAMTVLIDRPLRATLPLAQRTAKTAAIRRPIFPSTTQSS